MEVLRWQWIAAVALGAAFASPLAAEPNQPATETAPAPEKTKAADDLSREPVGGRDGDDNDNGIKPWIQMLLALALIVGLIFVARWLLVRFAPAGRLGGSPAICVVARATLTPKHQLFLVRLGRRLLLIGTGPEGAERLSEITDAEEIAELEAAAKAKPGSLAAARKRKGRPQDTQGQQNDKE